MCTLRWPICSPNLAPQNTYHSVACFLHKEFWGPFQSMGSWPLATFLIFFWGQMESANAHPLRIEFSTPMPHDATILELTMKLTPASATLGQMFDRAATSMRSQCIQNLSWRSTNQIKSYHYYVAALRRCTPLNWTILMSIFEVSCVFLLSGPLYSCAAYAAVYAMPTRPQWEPTRLIPLKVCLRRPNARVKRRLNVRFCLRRHTSVCFWKVGNGTFAYATTVPFTFLVSGVPYGTLHSLQQHERPGSKAPIDILQPYPCAAAAPATRSQSAH